MKLHEDYQQAGAEIGYLLDTKDGQFAEGHMRASVAEEIVHSAETRSLNGREGYELVVNDRMLFPKDAFVFDEGEEVERGVKRTAKKSGRPTKAELLKEAGETMTNPELHGAIKESKARKAAKAGNTED